MVFTCVACSGSLPTSDRRKDRGLQLASRWYICLSAKETIDHLRWKEFASASYFIDRSSTNSTVNNTLYSPTWEGGFRPVSGGAGCPRLVKAASINMVHAFGQRPEDDESWKPWDLEGNNEVTRMFVWLPALRRRIQAEQTCRSQKVCYGILADSLHRSTCTGFRVQTYYTECSDKGDAAVSLDHLMVETFLLQFLEAHLGIEGYNLKDGCSEWGGPWKGEVDWSWSKRWQRDGSLGWCGLRLKYIKNLN